MSKKPTPQPWHPAPYDDLVTMAIKALASGNASDAQQKRALRWIIETLCGTYDLSFRDGALEGERATAFAEGKRHVGLQLVKHVNMPMAQRVTK